MDEVIDISIAPGPSLGELNLMIDAFENAIGQAGFDEVDNAVPVRNDGFGKALKRWNLGGIDLGAPLGQEGVGTVFIRHTPEVIEEDFETIRLAQRGI